MISLRPPQAEDRLAWERLARGYKAFYKTELPPAAFEAAWQGLLNDGPARGLLLQLNGAVVGLAHYLFHASTWGEPVCYLQDLFVDPAQRGLGLGAQLIEAVAGQARQQGAQRLYWLTQADNTAARALYDRVAEHRGFIRYDYVIAPA